MVELRFNADEEFPSDHKIEVKLVEVHENTEYKQRIDELIRKLNLLVSESDAGILKEIKEILSDLNLAIKSVEAKSLSSDAKFFEIERSLAETKDALNLFSASNYGKIDDVARQISESVQDAASMSDAKFFDLAANIRQNKDAIESLSDSVKAVHGRTASSDAKLFDLQRDLSDTNEAIDVLSESIKSLQTMNEGKFYELNDNVQDIKDKINKRSDSEAKEMILALSDKLDASSSTLLGVRDKIDETSSSLNDKLDSVRAQSAQLDALAIKLDEMRTPTDAILALSDKLDAMQSPAENMIGDLAIHMENLSEKYEDIARIASERQADADVMDRHIISELDAIKNSVVSDSKIKALNNAINRVNRTQLRVDSNVKEFSAYLQRLNSIDYMLRLIAARNLLKTRKRLPKWAREKKKVLDRLILGMEDEVADILIVNAIPKTGMTMTDLSKAIGRSRRKTTERVAALMAAGYVEERKIKRKTLYFLVA